MLNSINDFKNTLNYFAPITDDDHTSKVTTTKTTSTNSNATTITTTVFICPIDCYNAGVCNFISLDTGASIKSCNTSSSSAACIGIIITIIKASLHYIVS